MIRILQVTGAMMLLIVLSFANTIAQKRKERCKCYDYIKGG
jgi:hypothetical protein